MERHKMLTVSVKLHTMMKKIATWPAWVGSLILVVAGYFISTGTFIGADHVRAASGGTPMLDTFFFYTPGRAYELLTAMGEAGRSAYLSANLVDFFFPPCYTLFFVTSLAMIYTFIYEPEDKRNWLVLVPFGAMLADYGENICVRLMLLVFPTVIMPAAQAASLLTPLKFTLIVTAALLIMQGNMKVTNKLFAKK